MIFKTGLIASEFFLFADVLLVNLFLNFTLNSAVAVEGYKKEIAIRDTQIKALTNRIGELEKPTETRAMLW